MAIEPMLANAIEWDRIADKAAGYTMEPKLDGVRCIADCREGDKVRLWSRGGKELTEKLPELCEYLSHRARGLILDGELGYTQYPTDSPHDAYIAIDFNKTMRVLGSGPDVARQKQIENFINDGSHIRFYVFDVLDSTEEYFVGDMPLHDYTQELRRRVLETWAKAWDIPINWFRSEGYHPVGIVPSWTGFDEITYNHIVNSGGEGVILKNPQAIYWPGKRKARTWYKVKAYESIDVQVLGYTDALPGKFEGQIGAIVFGAISFDGEHTDVWGKCSGMDDATRRFITDNKEQCLGRWFELRHFGRVGKGGDGYRFPQFLRWRPDRD